jgi:lipopolysaccharide/colanic/teichoic acid biosynthesis glycosyltransferase
MRYGYRGEPLYVWKFRSMQMTASPAQHQQYVMNIADEDEDVQLKKMDNDSKLIPLGKWLRCTAIDELPQLFNVLKGDMSLVGPRPDVVPVHKYHDWQQVRFDVVPGLTGLWQVSGKNHTTFNEMNKLDATYVENRSVWLDLKIVILTGPAILKQVAENLFSQNHSN